MSSHLVTFIGVVTPNQNPLTRAGRSSEAERSLMVRWVVGSILHGGPGARYSSVLRAFAHGAVGRRIDPSWGGPIELFLVPASAP